MQEALPIFMYTLCFFILFPGMLRLLTLAKISLRSTPKLCPWLGHTEP